MDPKYFNFNQEIGKLVKSPADQGRIIAIAIALAAAANARLPSSPVRNLAMHYADQVFQDVTEKISEINESIVFSAKSAQEYVQVFWKMRYYAAFPIQMADANFYRMRDLVKSPAAHGMDLMTVWAGGVVELSEELNQFMSKFKAEIAILAATAAVMIAPVLPNDSPENAQSTETVEG